MKLIYNIWMKCVVLLSLCCLFSCVGDEIPVVPDVTEEGDTYVNIIFTRTAMPTVEENLESGINSLRVFIFNNLTGALEFTRLYTVPINGHIENPLIKVTPGLKDIYVVANEDGEKGVYPNTAPFFNFTLVTEKRDLDNMLISGDRGNVESFLYDRSFMEAHGFLMTGKSLSQTVPEGKSQNNPQKIEVELIRNIARIDLKVKTEETIASVCFQSAVFRSLCSRSRLFEQVGVTSNPAGAVYSGVGDFGYGSPLSSSFITVDTYYACENIGYTTTSHDNALTVDLTWCVERGGVSQTFTKTIPVSKLFNIARNTKYIMEVTMLASGGIDFNLFVEDWNDVIVNGDIHGARLDVEKSKVVMDWWNLGQSFTTTDTFDADDPVTFDGYYVDGVKVETLPSWLSISMPSFPTTHGTITMTYQITEGIMKNGYGGYHPDVVFYLRSANIIHKITVVYDNGYLPNDMLSAAGWPAAALPDRGIHMSKRLCSSPEATVAGNLAGNFWVQTYPWPSIKNLFPNAMLQNRMGGTTHGELFGKGPRNTDNWVADKSVVEPAIYIRENLGPDWYWPSLYEADVILHYNNYLGYSYLLCKLTNPGTQANTLATSTTGGASYLFLVVGGPYVANFNSYTLMTLSINPYSQVRGIINM